MRWALEIDRTHFSISLSISIWIFELSRISLKCVGVGYSSRNIEYVCDQTRWVIAVWCSWGPVRFLGSRWFITVYLHPSDFVIIHFSDSISVQPVVLHFGSTTRSGISHCLCPHRRALVSHLIEFSHVRCV